MAVVYKDINLLTEESSPTGNEKLPVSDTKFITVNKITQMAGIKQRTVYTSSDTTVSGLAWDTVHVFPEMASLNLSLASFPSDGKNHEIIIEFISGSTATTFAAITGITWAFGLTLPTMVQANSKYQISIDGSMVACFIQAANS